MMKRCLPMLLMPLCLWATEPVPMPPQEEAPFRVVIEEVAEPAPAAEETPVDDPETPVAESVEEEPMTDPVPNCGHVTAPPKAYDLEVLMLQIFLDRHNFSGGVIDGVWGQASREAMRAWQRSEGLRPTQWVDVALYGRIAEMPEPLIRYTVTEADVALVTGPMPPTWAERARLSLMGYETLGACLAERFHTSERTLRRLNPAIINWPEDLAVGTVLMVPNVRMAALERPATIVIALEDCVLAGFDAQGVMRLRFPCSIARNKAHLPKTGEVTVKNMAPAPNYTYDPANYGQDPSVGKMVVPAGPRNPVGSRWIGLSLPGYGIHGTPRPNTVGRPESRGCFRLTNWNAEKLFELIRPGTPVAIVRSLKEYRPPVAPAAVTPAQEATPAPAEKPAEPEQKAEEKAEEETPAAAEPEQKPTPEPAQAPEQKEVA